ncbi:phosphate/phosphite/phosphonate ABC transporter substrate-binding protein [Dehalococcoidia bacterium]|nr:phosphate/phosphite/phosphonate ABC transporter substrate-binding protein [Dehalococcoidia bacterium]
MSKRLVSGIMVAVLLITGLAVAGCPRPETVASPEKANWPEVLRFGAGFGEHPDEIRARWAPVGEYLERELGIPVEVYAGADYTAVIEAMRVGRIELARFGPFGYILAAERAYADAIVTTGIVTEEHPEGILDTYHSYIITHPGTGLRSMDDVKRRSGELTLAWVDPASTSGFLIPKGHFLDIGIDPDRHFREVKFAGSHTKAVLAVTAGKVDVGANCLIEDMIEEGKVTPDEVIILWKSPPLPRGPFAVRRDMDPELRRRIVQALTNMREKDPEGFYIVTRGRMNRVFMPVDDSRYDFFRPLARALGFIE